jgi:hypothetical protein
MDLNALKNGYGGWNHFSKEAIFDVLLTFMHIILFYLAIAIYAKAQLPPQHLRLPTRMMGESMHLAVLRELMS